MILCCKLHYNGGYHATYPSTFFDISVLMSWIDLSGNWIHFPSQSSVSHGITGTCIVIVLARVRARRHIIFAQKQ